MTREEFKRRYNMATTHDLQMATVTIEAPRNSPGDTQIFLNRPWVFDGEAWIAATFEELQLDILRAKIADLQRRLTAATGSEPSGTN